MAKKYTVTLTAAELKLLEEAADGAVHWHYCFLMDGGQIEDLERDDPKEAERLHKRHHRLQGAKLVIARIKQSNA